MEQSAEVDGVMRLPRARLDEATAVLVAAFWRDPMITSVFAGLDDCLPGAMRALFQFSCAVRFELDWPLIGVERAGQLAGVLGITAVEDAAWPSTLSAVYDQYKALIGPAATARFERYSALADAQRPVTPNVSVGVLGVHPAAQGQGLGRRLLAAAQALSVAHPTSTGVALDPENPASRRFYERCGYQIIGHTRLDDVVDVWGMFRPNDRAPDERPPQET